MSSARWRISSRVSLGFTWRSYRLKTMACRLRLDTGNVYKGSSTLYCIL